MNGDRAEMFRAIRGVAEKALSEIAASDGPTRRAMGAVNWGDLGIGEILRCEREDASVVWRIEIGEASPGCELARPVYAALNAAFPGVQFEVATEW